MQEFERSETVNASSDWAFDFLSNINNLPQYLPTVRNVRREGADRVRVQSEAAGIRSPDAILARPVIATLSSISVYF